MPALLPRIGLVTAALSIGVASVALRAAILSDDPLAPSSASSPESRPAAALPMFAAAAPRLVPRVAPPRGYVVFTAGGERYIRVADVDGERPDVEDLVLSQNGDDTITVGRLIDQRAFLIPNEIELDGCVAAVGDLYVVSRVGGARRKETEGEDVDEVAQATSEDSGQDHDREARASGELEDGELEEYVEHDFESESESESEAEAGEDVATEPWTPDTVHQFGTTAIAARLNGCEGSTIALALPVHRPRLVTFTDGDLERKAREALIASPAGVAATERWRDLGIEGVRPHWYEEHVPTVTLFRHPGTGDRFASVQALHYGECGDFSVSAYALYRIAPSGSFERVTPADMELWQPVTWISDADGDGEVELFSDEGSLYGLRQIIRARDNTVVASDSVSHYDPTDDGGCGC